MQIFILLLVALYAIIVNAQQEMQNSQVGGGEGATLMKPMGNTQWVVDHLESIEWKFTPQFRPDGYQGALVQLYKGDPRQGGQVRVNVIHVVSMEDTGVAFKMPAVEPADDYYAVVKILSGGQTHHIQSEAISVIDRANADFGVTTENDVSIESDATQISGRLIFATAAAFFLS